MGEADSPAKDATPSSLERDIEAAVESRLQAERAALQQQLSAADAKVTELIEEVATLKARVRALEREKRNAAAGQALERNPDEADDARSRSLSILRLPTKRQKVSSNSGRDAQTRVPRARAPGNGPGDERLPRPGRPGQQQDAPRPRPGSVLVEGFTFTSSAAAPAPLPPMQRTRPPGSPAVRAPGPSQPRAPLPPLQPPRPPPAAAFGRLLGVPLHLYTKQEQEGGKCKSGYWRVGAGLPQLLSPVQLCQDSSLVIVAHRAEPNLKLVCVVTVISPRTLHPRARPGRSEGKCIAWRESADICSSIASITETCYNRFHTAYKDAIA